MRIFPIVLMCSVVVLSLAWAQAGIPPTASEWMYCILLNLLFVGLTIASYIYDRRASR